jgi:hypothetical protein
MCDDCSKKLLQLDSKIPHFIDRYHGEKFGRMPTEEEFDKGLKELWGYMKGRHGKLVLVE